MAKLRQSRLKLTVKSYVLSASRRQGQSHAAMQKLVSKNLSAALHQLPVLSLHHLLAHAMCQEANQAQANLLHPVLHQALRRTRGLRQAQDPKFSAATLPALAPEQEKKLRENN